MWCFIFGHHWQIRKLSLTNRWYLRDSYCLRCGWFLERSPIVKFLLGKNDPEYGKEGFSKLPKKMLWWNWVNKKHRWPFCR